MSSNNNSSEPTPAVNLYAYAASAVPPKMDREIHLARGETPRGDFWIDTKVARPLRQVHQINPFLISDRAQKYPIPVGQIIPEPSPSTLDNLVLPGKNHTRGNPKTLTRFGGVARTMDDVGHWVDRVVLCTAIAILNLSSPFTGWQTVLQQGTRIQAAPDDPGSGEDTIECRVNILRRQLTGRDVYQPHMVVFSFPPWKVTPNDFRDFSKPLRFNPHSVGPKADPFLATRLSRREKMWYYINDICMGYNCRWFAITSADYWCFGIFGAGWKGGYSSPPLPFFSRQPTVLQVLNVWAMSSIYENHAANRFVMPLRLIDTVAAESIIGEGTLDEDSSQHNGHIQEETPTEVDEREAAGGESAGDFGIVNGTLESGAVVTRWGDEGHGEFSSINVLEDQPTPTPADHSMFRQAALGSASSHSRASRRFAPYPLPSSQAQRESHRIPLTPIQETFDNTGSAAAGPSSKVDKGKGRAIDISPAGLKGALPAISNALARSASAPASVLSIPFRSNMCTSFRLRTVERLTEQSTVIAEEHVLDSVPTAGPSGHGQSPGNPATPVTRGSSFLEHRASLAVFTPSSPIAGPSFTGQEDGIPKDDEDVPEATE
ncbi:hypothetical protein FRC04_001457 [Tulasnella sp. 424]|nr:hypothetical protein FRC04_001457 [Tulasnella sp. 424]KAG8972730.1 hypothetical protein FRC05_009651 [Tulasnella sp. 425]